MGGQGKNEFGEWDPREILQGGTDINQHSNTALETMSQETRDGTRTLPTIAEIGATSPTVDELIWELHWQGYQFNIEPCTETALDDMGRTRRGKVEYWRSFFIYYTIAFLQEMDNAHASLIVQLRRIWQDILDIEASEP